MICPKCEEGRFLKIQFNKNGQKAFLCDFCETLWLWGEDINFRTGHALESYVQSAGTEYTITEFEEKGQDYEPVQYKDYR